MFAYLCTTCMASGVEPFEIDTCLCCGGHLEPLPSLAHAARRKAEMLGAALERGRLSIRSGSSIAAPDDGRSGERIDSERLLTVDEASALLNLSRDKVTALIKAGRLPATNFGTEERPLYRLSRSALVATAPRLESPPAELGTPITASTNEMMVEDFLEKLDARSRAHRGNDR